MVTMQTTIALSLIIVLVVNRLKKSHKTYTKESNWYRYPKRWNARSFAPKAPAAVATATGEAEEDEEEDWEVGTAKEAGTEKVAEKVKETLV